MKNAKNKLLLILLVIILSVSGLIGCKNDENKLTESQTDVSETKDKETEKESEAGKLSDYPEGTFDGEEVCKHIEINGKVVEFPWTLNKLGDEYEFEDVIINNNVYMAKLMYKGEYVVDVFGKEKEVNRDTPIEYVIFSKKENVKICGIEWENTSIDVKRIFGEPKEKENDGIFYKYLYETKSVQLFFWINYDSTIDAFYISTTGEWNTVEE